jgi:hypothetical protein
MASLAYPLPVNRRPNRFLLHCACSKYTHTLDCEPPREAAPQPVSSTLGAEETAEELELWWAPQGGEKRDLPPFSEVP